MKIYVTPKMNCEKLQFFEKIANKCWEGTKFFYDFDDDNINDTGDSILLDIKGCNNGKHGMSKETIVHKIKSSMCGVDLRKWEKEIKHYKGSANQTLLPHIGCIPSGYNGQKCH